MHDRDRSGSGNQRREGSAGRGRKERVLHTRISDDLAEDLRRMAEDLRVPVSNLVRTVLEDAFSVVEKVTDNVGDLLEEVVDEAEAARDRIRQRHHQRRQRHPHRTSRFASEDREAPVDRTREPHEPGSADSEVLGWQPLFLAKTDHCSECASGLARGAQAYAAVSRTGLGSAILCEPCMRAQGVSC